MLKALAQVYSTSIDRFAALLYSENELSPILDQRSRPNNTFPDQSRNETTLLSTDSGQARTPYLRAIIGKLDQTLHPMVPPGSIVQIDSGQREISAKKDWSNEFQRPIYLLRAKDGYVCGWCELDENSRWLTLIPHPLSPAPSRRWIYGTEVENLGKVMSVVIWLAD
jgi:hypothetical protein